MSFDAGSMTGSLGINTDPFAKGMLKATSIASLFPATVTNFLANPLLGVVGVMKSAGEAIVGGLKLIHQNFLDVGHAADNMGEAAQKAGVSAAFLSTVGRAAADAGGSVESLGDALKFLSKNAAEASSGNKAVVADFERIGVSVLDSSGKLKDNERLFNEVADAIAAIEDPARRTNAAMQLLGRGGNDLVPLLSQGAGAIKEQAALFEELGATMDAELVRAGDKVGTFGVIWDAAWQGIRNEAARPLLLAFEANFDDAVDAVKVGSKIVRQIVGEVSIAVVKTGATIADFLKGNWPLIKTIGGFLGTVIVGNIKYAAEATKLAFLVFLMGAEQAVSTLAILTAGAALLVDTLKPAASMLGFGEEFEDAEKKALSATAALVKMKADIGKMAGGIAKSSMGESEYSRWAEVWEKKFRAGMDAADKTPLPPSDVPPSPTEPTNTPGSPADAKDKEAKNQKRIADSIAQYESRAKEASLRAAGDSYAAETVRFESEWQRRIDATTEGEERNAAIQARAAEREQRRIERETQLRKKAADEVAAKERERSNLIRQLDAANQKQEPAAAQTPDGAKPANKTQGLLDAISQGTSGGLDRNARGNLLRDLRGQSKESGDLPDQIRRQLLAFNNLLAGSDRQERAGAKLNELASGLRTDAPRIDEAIGADAKGEQRLVVMRNRVRELSTEIKALQQTALNSSVDVASLATRAMGGATAGPRNSPPATTTVNTGPISVPALDGAQLAELVAEKLKPTVRTILQQQLREVKAIGNSEKVEAGL